MTSPVEQITVVCPGCGQEYEDWHRRSVNAMLDPEMAADRAYMRAASTATCPSCGKVVRLGTLVVAIEATPKYGSSDEAASSSPSPSSPPAAAAAPRRSRTPTRTRPSVA
jgi:endogenous inhibitor of DNA gyrase (YacG/DUF329 family)